MNWFLHFRRLRERVDHNLRNCCVVTTLHSVVPIVVWVEKWLSLDTWQS